MLSQIDDFHFLLMRIPVKVATCYDPKRPAIPIETGHPI